MSRTKATKYIFVTGGVLSGLGKGITAASIGNVLKARGLSVNIQKCDPYINVDAGTLNPAEHGECFVTKDGAETDLDLGHYERFIDRELDQRSSLMSGRVLSQVISDERKGKYLGKTVQIIPHVTSAIQDEIEKAGNGFDVHIVEIGGTVGDYEGLAFLEAIREFAGRVGRKNCCYVHVVYLPYLGASKEVKTKPAQNAVRDLRAVGIVPDVLVARSEEPANSNVVQKLSDFGGVDIEGICLLPNAETVYEVPLTMEEQGTSNFIAKTIGLKTKKPNFKEWSGMVQRAKDTKKSTDKVRVGVIAKYMDNEDTYMSVFEALRAAGWKHSVGLEIVWVDSEKLETEGIKRLKKLDGILVPGGFGSRGIEGKIKAANYAIENKVPYLGLCLGLQISLVSLARGVFGKKANTIEVDETCEHPIIHLMESQKSITKKGGTMRLGDYKCVLKSGTKARKLYGRKEVMERHRHRYEVNNAYRKQLEDVGVVFSGLSPDGELVELFELKDHPFFMASQFHPEFLSRPNRPHPLFDGFIAELKKRT